MSRLLRLPHVTDIIGLKKSAIYTRINAGLFPAPVSLGYRAVAWPEPEVHAVNNARIAGKTDDQIRALVKELHVRRQEAK